MHDSPLLVDLIYFSTEFAGKTPGRAGEMAQGVKALAAGPGDLSLTPRMDLVEGESLTLHVVLWPPHVFCCVCMITCKQKQIDE